jgi:hypothetical protein
MTKSHLTEFELDIHQKRRLDDLLQKITFRKKLNAANVNVYYYESIIDENMKLDHVLITSLNS